MVHVDDLDVLVDASCPQPMYEAATPNSVSDAIARRILALLPDRPLLQLGIGAVPEALVATLADANADGLRFTGMGSDGMVDLAARGLLARDHLDGVPPVSAPDLLGTRLLMDWADDNPSVGVYPSTFAQNPIDLAARARLVSVNSAVEVDLRGQVNSERVRGRQISGVGGSIDFVEGAAHSAGGLRIIALPSTTPDGTISRIVSRLGQDSVVTIASASVDVVVTEHGVAASRGQVRESARSRSPASPRRSTVMHS
jgi:4-hydroxybutyrate CoA-transferase